ncbi:outer membrane protein [Xanthobacter sp. V4C-4]|uniref:outer membrane protein n=1 Tax=Xanthobacter cornucopiae TaxID=3119924 RepID=UPI00372A04E7
MLKRALLGVSALALLAGSASAADLSTRYPVKAALMPAQLFSWTGFYVGGNVGWGFASNSFSATSGGLTYGYDVGSSNGFIGGLQTGYNFQFANNVVVGAEADLEFADIGKESLLVGGPAGGFTASSNVDYFGTIRGRLGYAFDRFLPYFTGGAAWGKTGFTGPWAVSSDGVRWGWTVGGGAEYALTNNWTVKAEYLYIDLGDKTVTYPSGESVTGGVTLNTVKAGVNYKF